MVQLQQDLPKIEATGAQLVAVSYDSVDILKGFAERRKITFPLLSDPGSQTIRAYGILNKEATGRAEGVPYPGSFFLDGQGFVREKIFLTQYQERHTTEELLKGIEKIK